LGKRRKYEIMAKILPFIQRVSDEFELKPLIMIYQAYVKSSFQQWNSLYEKFVDILHEKRSKVALLDD